jgi:hypothetical protein
LGVQVDGVVKVGSLSANLPYREQTVAERGDQEAGSTQMVTKVVEEHTAVPTEENEQKREMETIREWIVGRHKKVLKGRQKESQKKRQKE